MVWDLGSRTVIYQENVTEDLDGVYICERGFLISCTIGQMIKANLVTVNLRGLLKFRETRR